MTNILKLILLTIIAFASAQQAIAQEFIRFENRWKPAEQIHNQTGPVTSGAAQPGWYSAQWLTEPVPGTEFYRLKNRWKGAYLHNQNGSLELGPVEPDWESAMWAFENSGYPGYHRVQNQQSKEYLHNQNGSLELGAIEPGWWSAQWKLLGFTGTGSAPAAQASASTSSAPKPAVALADGIILQNCPDGSKVAAGGQCPAEKTRSVATASAAPQASNSGCPGGQRAVERDGLLICEGAINVASPTGTAVEVKEGDPKPVQYFVDQAADRCADPGNFMLDGWNTDARPLLEEAGRKLIAKKGFATGPRGMSQLIEKLKADPVLRWQFAPFMVESAWGALKTQTPSAAQSTFRTMFTTWAGCDKNLTARRMLAGWNQHMGRSDAGSSINGVGIEWIDPNPQYKPVTLSILTERGASLRGFDVTNAGNPAFIGWQGKMALAMLYNPVKVTASPEMDDLENLRFIQDDFTGMMIGTGVGFGLASASATTLVVGTIPVYVSIKASLFTASTNAAIAANTAAAASAKAAGTTAAVIAPVKAKVTAAMVSKAVSTSAGPVVVVAVIAAIILGEELADVVKTQEYEDGLKRDAKSFGPIDLDKELGANPSEIQKMAVFSQLMKMLISEPADRNKLSLEVPLLDCPMGMMKAANACVWAVEFYDRASMSHAEAKAFAASNGWRLASPEDVKAAWNAKALDKYAFGMMSDGNFAVPVQRDYSNFKKGHNIGATGGNQGFFFVREFMEPDARRPDRALIQNGEHIGRVILPGNGAPVRGGAGKNADGAAWVFEKTGDHYRIKYPKDESQALFVEGAGLRIGRIAANDPKGRWKLHRADGSFYRLESVSAPHRYILLKNDQLALNYIEPNDKAALWHIPLER